MRRTAQRVDEQLLTHMQAHAISGRVGGGRARARLRQRRPALDRLGALRHSALRTDCAAVDGDLHRDAAHPAARRGGSRPHRRRAAACDQPRRRGERAAERGPAHRRRPARLCPRPQRQPHRHRQIRPFALFEIVNGSVVHRSRPPLRGDQRPCHRRRAPPGGGGKPPREPVQTVRRHAGWRSYVASLASVAVGLGLAKLGFPYIGVENVDLVLLISAVGVAGRLGTARRSRRLPPPRFAYNFFFLPPLLHPDDRRPEKHRRPDLLRRRGDPRLSPFGARPGAGGDRAGSRPHHRCALSLQPQASRVGTLDDVLWVTAYQIASMLRVRVVLLLPDEERGIYGARRVSARGSAQTPGAPPPRNGRSSATAKPAAAPDTLPGGRWLFLPMRTNRGRRRGRRHRQRQGRRAFDAGRAPPARRADRSAALAIERVHLVEDLDRAKYAAERDRLRTARC